jgi:hypothetical protein
MYVDFIINLYRLFYQLFFAVDLDAMAPSMSREYHGDQSSWYSRSDWVDSSVFEVPITPDSESMLISLSILYQPFHQLLFAGGAMMMSGSSTPEASSTSISYSERDAAGQERTYNS